MTASDLLSRVSFHGGKVVVLNGSPRVVPAGGGDWLAGQREAVAALAPDLARLRSEVLELVQADVWDAAWALRRMAEADAAVEAAGGVGLDPQVWDAAAECAAAWAACDRAAVAAWCGVVEDRARELGRLRRDEIGD